MPPEKELQKPESEVSVNVDAYTADDKFSKKKFADGHDTIPGTSTYLLHRNRSHNYRGWCLSTGRGLAHTEN